MRSRRFWGGVALVALSLPLVLLSSTGAALAHERRNVGPYTFVVGFINEPAFSDMLNGVDLRITQTATGEPVTGAEQTLKVTVMQGSDSRELSLRARFNQPGAYVADFVPTRPGQYRFRFTGTIAGTPINELFESGPGRFNDVEDAAKLKFPAPAAAPAQDTSAQLTQLARQVATLERTLQETQGAASNAQLFGLAGTVIGLVGLGVGVWALTRGRREQPTGQPAQQRA
ncbi:MAG: hypothetical protein KatS3mg061_3444 [Dehalococcoidia bacterium]|nr:MAG: hypothetical protein KatS3mg061_3444 [Dehalococcoidia bacterium]